jgi:hypothetical protein
LEIHPEGTVTAVLAEPNQPQGVLTSIPLLAHRPKGGKQISAQWHFSLLGQSYQWDAISQFHLRIPIKVQLGFNKVWIKEDGK